MGISRDHWHKRRATGGKRKPIRKKRKFELGRPAANTKLGPQRIHTTEAEEEVLNKKRSKKTEAKYKARQRFAKVEAALEEQFSTGRVLACIASRPGQCGRADGYILEGISRDHWHKRRATGGKRKPIRKKRKFELGRPAANTKLGPQRIHTTEAEEEVLNKKRSKKTEAKYKARQRFAKVEAALEEQFSTGRVLACIASRPGQCGRADGYILEGKELEFYMRKIKSKKAK
ncbi:hypothetical protein HZH68_004834 [Vespula germanica]|uniref:Small ribosomal subunit protein eS8 n=1 Tax=Vespula germanica TaxID=30212 RepID=A0A834KPK1_VESGE|nr:hypothetical protein HZH68_004834 [Vespula germanica]